MLIFLFVFYYVLSSQMSDRSITKKKIESREMQMGSDKKEYRRPPSIFKKPCFTQPSNTTGGTYKGSSQKNEPKVLEQKQQGFSKNEEHNLEEFQNRRFYRSSNDSESSESRIKTNQTYLYKKRDGDQQEIKNQRSTNPFFEENESEESDECPQTNDAGRSQITNLPCASFYKKSSNDEQIYALEDQNSDDYTGSEGETDPSFEQSSTFAQKRNKYQLSTGKTNHLATNHSEPLSNDDHGRKNFERSYLEKSRSYASSLDMIKESCKNDKKNRFKSNSIDDLLSHTQGNHRPLVERPIINRNNDTESDTDINSVSTLTQAKLLSFADYDLVIEAACETDPKKINLQQLSIALLPSTSKLNHLPKKKSDIHKYLKSSSSEITDKKKSSTCTPTIIRIPLLALDPLNSHDKKSDYIQIQTDSAFIKYSPLSAPDETGRSTACRSNEEVKKPKTKEENQKKRNDESEKFISQESLESDKSKNSSNFTRKRASFRKLFTSKFDKAKKYTNSSIVPLKKHFSGKNDESSPNLSRIDTPDARRKVKIIHLIPDKPSTNEFSEQSELPRKKRMAPPRPPCPNIDKRTESSNSDHDDCSQISKKLEDISLKQVNTKKSYKSKRAPQIPPNSPLIQSKIEDSTRTQKKQHPDQQSSSFIQNQTKKMSHLRGPVRISYSDESDDEPEMILSQKKSDHIVGLHDDSDEESAEVYSVKEKGSNFHYVEHQRLQCLNDGDQESIQTQYSEENETDDEVLSVIEEESEEYDDNEQEEEYESEEEVEYEDEYGRNEQRPQEKTERKSF